MMEEGLSKFLSDLQSLVILHLPLLRTAMKVAASLQPQVFIRGMREKFENFNDEELDEALRKIKHPEGVVEQQVVDYLISLGVLDRVIQAAEEVIFLRKHKEGLP